MARRTAVSINVRASSRRIASAITGVGLLCCVTLAGCFGDSSSSGSAQQTTGFQAGDPGSSLKKTLNMSAGGPYLTTVGMPITLQGRYNVSGQAGASDQLYVIGRALKAYLAANGTYPPAALTNSSGQATVSWRVLILPYLGEQALFAKFDLSKPWNDPVNQPLLALMPAVFRTEGALSGATETGFAGVSGTDSLFQSSAANLNGGRSSGDITGGTTEHIAAGPVAPDVHLPWSAPGDIDIANAKQLGAPGGFSGSGNAFTPLLFLDGTVRLIPDNVGTFAMISWAKLAGPGCTCSPPSQLDAGVRAFWDLNGAGSFTTTGMHPVFTATQVGTYTVALRLVDRFGGQYDSTAQVEVR